MTHCNVTESLTFVITTMTGMPRLVMSTFSPNGSMFASDSSVPPAPEGAVNLEEELLSGST